MRAMPVKANPSDYRMYMVGLFLATLLLIWYWRKSHKAKRPNGLKELPGPWGLPFLGNALQLGSFPNKQMCKWSEKYGSLFQTNLAGQQVVVVSDPKLAKEMFSLDVFSGRPHLAEFDIFEDEPGLGIINSEGERWESQRRFLLRQLRDFGFGKSAMETLIMDELNEVLDRFKAQVGESVTKVKETLRLAVVNSLWMILTNTKFKMDDPALNKLVGNTSDVFNDVIESGGLLFLFPWLKYIAPRLSGYTAVRRVLKENEELMKSTVQQHQDFDENNFRDFVDKYLSEVKKTTDPKSSFHERNSAERQLIAVLFDLLAAGNDTTSTTISWTLVYLCKLPEIQKRLQEEITQITGNTRQVSVADRPNMPYAQAIMEEVLRHSSIAPDGVQHTALADTEFRGYHIPKGAWIQANLYYIHHDPKIWGPDVEEFRPERFLTPEGTFQKNENLQAFQVGRRQCVGETLARDTFFLYMTNIFQQFSIRFDSNHPEPDYDTVVGFLRNTKPYHVIMTDRLSS